METLKENDQRALRLLNVRDTAALLALTPRTLQPWLGAKNCPTSTPMAEKAH